MAAAAPLRWLVVAVALILAPGLARGDHGDGADPQRAGRRALVVLRILAYDKTLARRAPGDKVVVLVVAGAGAAARAEQASWLAGFALLPKVKTGGRPVRAVAVAYDAASFDAVVGKLRPAAMIVTGVRPAAIAAVARAHQVLTVSAREAELRAGLAVGVLAEDDRDTIAINLDAARAEGVRFGAGLLQLARLVEVDE